MAVESSASPVAMTIPVTDHKLWNTLRTRVGSDAGKRPREDSLLLIRGFDSVYSSLSQLTGILDSAAQGVRELAKPSLADVLKDGIRTVKVYEHEDEPKPKKRCHSSTQNPETDNDDGKRLQRIDGAGAGIMTGNTHKLAVSMARKEALLTRDLEALKSELSFLQDRCALLEEENRKLKHGFRDGLLVDEDDDLVRLQLEALLAEKSRLAGENATILRENEYLHQLVDYHQLTSSQLSPPASSRRIKLPGTCLNFSLSDVDEEEEEEEEM